MSNVGKTGTIVRLANHIVNNNFKKVYGDEISAVDEIRDFRSILQNRGDGWCVAICSASDDENIIRGNKEFIEEMDKEINLIIMSCREE